jgi:hypothetical protein
MAQSPDPMAKMVLGGAKLAAEGKFMTFTLELPKEMVEGGIKDMGKQLQAQLAAPGAKPAAPKK